MNSLRGDSCPLTLTSAQTLQSLVQYAHCFLTFGRSRLQACRIRPSLCQQHHAMMIRLLEVARVPTGQLPPLPVPRPQDENITKWDLFLVYYSVVYRAWDFSRVYVNYLTSKCEKNLQKICRISFNSRFFKNNSFLFKVPIRTLGFYLFVIFGYS